MTKTIETSYRDPHVDGTESDEEIKNNSSNTDLSQKSRNNTILRNSLADHVSSLDTGRNDYGVCKGIVTDYDEDNAGPDDLPWGIQWMDEEFTNFGRRHGQILHTMH